VNFSFFTFLNVLEIATTEQCIVIYLMVDFRKKELFIFLKYVLQLTVKFEQLLKEQSRL